MNSNEQLNLDTPESGRRLPIEGRPFAIIMEELWNDSFGHVVR